MTPLRYAIITMVSVWLAGSALLIPLIQIMEARPLFTVTSLHFSH